MSQDKKTDFDKKKRNLTQPNFSLGKVPPQEIEAEETLLGTLLSWSTHIVMVIDLLKPEIFYNENHKMICEAMINLHISSKKVDNITVIAELRKTGKLEAIGGVMSVMYLMDKANNPSHIHDYTRIVYQAFLLRELIRCFSEGIQNCYELADPFDVLTNTTRILDELQQGTVTKSEVHISELAMGAIKDREQNPGEKVTLGLSTGLTDLDKAIGGLQEEQLIIIGARPAMGKTAVALAIAKNIGLMLKEPVALFSLEMSAKQLYTRFQAQVSGLESKKIKYNRLSTAEAQVLFSADGDLSEAQIFIDDTPALNIDRFRAKATIMKHKHGLKAIIIDYLQLMKGSKGSFNKEAEVSEISGKLKQVAKELQIPIIALCQLSRAVESRPGSNKLPQLSDLRDSGAIEQDADTIIFLWRPEYYGYTDPVEFRHFNVDILPKDLLALIIAKQREGETMIIPTMLKLNTMTLSDHPDLHTVHSNKPVQSGINFPTASGYTLDPDQDDNGSPF